MSRAHRHPEPPAPEGTPEWAEWVKDYYRDVETYDWVAATDRFTGPETLFHRRRSAEARRLIARHLGPGDGPILDAGCGTGLITRHLPPGATGIDINPRNIEVARRRMPEHAFVLGDVEALPFADATFGGAVCTEVIEHIPAPDLALREIARVLRPGGVLIGMTPGTSPVWSLRFLSRSCPHSEPFHRSYTTDTVARMLADAGMDAVRVDYTLLRMSVAFVARRPGGG